jgi:glycosyltransferase involved in cell wall biosynthesis
LDGIFILNDPWCVARYLAIIKDNLKNRQVPPIVVYFPVDAMDLDPKWFIDYEMVTQAVVYTQFGYNEVLKTRCLVEPIIIPHGVDTDIFYKMDKEKSKRKLYPNKDNFYEESFIVLNANRNQPRKKVEITMQAFALFAQDKPTNVKLYMHMGTKDAGVDILKLAARYGIDKRLILTGTTPGIQQVPEKYLNLIYNATDVGLNTCLGEGWSLTNMEHTVTGAPQIVPDHSALHELYSDCGLLVPVSQWVINQDVMTTAGLVHPKDVADKLELIYNNKELYNELSEKSYLKFTNAKYNWKTIVDTYWIPLFQRLFT